MPMYEYKCAHCGKRFEVLQKFSDAQLTVHEECGSGPVERLISAPTFNFKGSGWYVTDYAKKNGGGKQESATSASESKSDAKPESKSDAKSDSKPASGTDSSSTTAPAPAAATPSTSSSSSSSAKSDK